MMRFKKGSKVEVFCQKEKPAGSWRCAEIMHGNGHNYTVKYDMCAFGESIEEKVPRKLIRPCPPPLVGVAENWRPGDVVEILHNHSWMMATVSEVLGRDCFLVRLVGSSNEFKVGKFKIRTRQSWLDGKWIVVGKGSMNYDNRKNNHQLIVKHKGFMAANSKMNLRVKDDDIVHKKNIKIQNAHNFPFRKLKRESPYCYPQAEAHSQKFGEPKRDSKRHRVSVDDLSQLPRKVKDIDFAADAQGKKEIPSFANNRTLNFSDVDEERSRTNGAVWCSTAISLEHNDADKATCSASSSSVGSNDPFNWPCGTLVDRGEYAEDHSSDAESVCWSYDEERNSFAPTKEELAAEIHRLELHAYRCTMEALHASGPLSWEQETLMTNLRISLHISNDEHLTELRNLISNSRSIPIS